MAERQIMIDGNQMLSRRYVGQMAAAALLAVGVGSVTLGRVAAREVEAGDDRKGRGRGHGNGRDDVSAAREVEPGDDRGGHGGGNDDPAGDDRGGRHKGGHR